MPGIRVLIVDDSVVIRKVLGEALATDSEIELAGSAPDGNIALAKIPLLKPDIVTLDVEMPGKSGIETLAAIRKDHPKLPVIMFSTLTERGATVTLEALALGASDYVTKPSNTGSVEQTRARIRSELIPKIKGLCRRAPATSPVTPAAIPKTSPHPAAIHHRPSSRIDILAIGTSTGGPNALAEVLPLLSKDLPVPVVVVQHMPPLFTRFLAERLDKQSSIRIREGEDGGLLRPGEAWIAPGDFHMKVARDGEDVRLRMNQDPPENSCRPAVDVLFRSVARTFGANAMAVVLTGMGSDGVKGCEEIKSAGGQVVVQDEASSVVWGMPGGVASAGLADSILPLAEVAREVERRVQENRLGLEWRKGHTSSSSAVPVRN